MVIQHTQVVFKGLRGRLAKVDEGLLDVLNELRDHKVRTCYSCQGTDKSHAYISASQRTSKRLIKRIKKALNEGLYSANSTEFVNEFMLGYRLWEFSFFRKNGANEVLRMNYEQGHSSKKGFAIEQSWNNHRGFRSIIRWPSDQTDMLLQLFKETPKK